MALSRQMRRKIAACDDFLCLVTENWLRSPTAYAQILYAREQGKPIIALIRSGLVLPPQAQTLLADAERHYFSTLEDLRVIHAMLEQRTGGYNLIDGGVYD